MEAKPPEEATPPGKEPAPKHVTDVKSIDDVRAELNSYLMHAAVSVSGLEVLGVEVDFIAGRYEVVISYAGTWNKRSASKLHELVGGRLGGDAFEIWGEALA